MSQQNAVNALRGLMIVGGTSGYLFAIDAGVLCFAVILLTLICARLYPRIAT